MRLTLKDDEGAQADALFAVKALARYVERTSPAANLQRELEATEAGRRMQELTAELPKLLDSLRPAAKVKGLWDQAKKSVEGALD